MSVRKNRLDPALERPRYELNWLIDTAAGTSCRNMTTFSTTPPSHHHESLGTHKRGSPGYVHPLAFQPPARPFPHLALTCIHPARTESLCNAIVDIRNPDPWGGNGYLSTILRMTKLADASPYSNVEELEPALDYATSAQRELGIREQAAGLVRSPSLVSFSCRLERRTASDSHQLQDFGEQNH